MQNIYITFAEIFSKFAIKNYNLVFLNILTSFVLDRLIPFLFFSPS